MAGFDWVEILSVAASLVAISAICILLFAM
jgi:hypothetical protein